MAKNELVTTHVTKIREYRYDARDPKWGGSADDDAPHLGVFVTPDEPTEVANVCNTVLSPVDVDGLIKRLREAKREALRNGGGKKATGEE